MERLLTPFGEKLDKDLPLDDYPRPQLKRDSFCNLNGKWKYAILDKNAPFRGYQGEIIVPFSPETILSGVEKQVKPTDALYYYRTFEFRKNNERAVLRFGAVDYMCTVKLNGREIGTHRGGYLPFSFEITGIAREGENELEVVVTDPSETGTQARGKQTSRRGGIWYTAQSGIWQTVWIEQLPANYIQTLKITPDIDENEVTVEAAFSDAVVTTEFTVSDREGNAIVTVTSNDGKAVIPMKDYELWSPENPYLYDLTLTAGKDVVKSYFGMRKFGVGKDARGVSRLTLNNKPYFQNGLLDQGYWSDGLYTAPSDEAMIYDIETMKKMGFNMLRKHIKIEPLRWYYHCDRLGMLVWQDAVCGGGAFTSKAVAVAPAFGLVFNTKKFSADDGEKNYAFFSREDKAGRDEYYDDSDKMIDLLYNTVSIALWVPFNEGWGQFDAAKACEFYKKKDPTRLVDHASGWHDQGAGDINSFHIYFTWFNFPKFDKKDERPVALTEYGGYSLKTEGHMYNREKFFGYRKYYEKSKFEKAMTKLFAGHIAKLIKSKGLSAAVYTEVSDVEDECNGLLTFDRRVVKIDENLMKLLNEGLKI